MTAAAACVASGAQAADLDLRGPIQEPVAETSAWDLLRGTYVHVGPGALIIDAGARISTPAGRYPGATIKVAPQVTATAEVGYMLTPEWGVSVTLGVPPTATVNGAGTVEALQTLGKTVYGPVAATAHYHLTGFGALQPYLGAGPAYMIDFNSKDGALSDLHVRSAWGVVGQVGADYMIGNHFGVFVDFKKAYLRTMAVGNLGAVPIRAAVKLDPYIVSGGMTYRF